MIINEVDNRDYIQQYLNTVDFQKNEYCQILVIRRKKDAGNEQVSQHVKTIKCYLVNKENFQQTTDEALKIARAFNARVYINPSPKNLKDVNYHLALEFMNEQYFGNFSNPYAKVNSVFAQLPGKSATRILMFDVDDNAHFNVESLVAMIRGVIENNKLRHDEQKIEVACIPSVSGKHILCRSFNTQKFDEIITSKGFTVTEDGKYQHDGDTIFELKKNSFTLVYACTNTEYLNK